jgi:hypothetical protein
MERWMRTAAVGLVLAVSCALAGCGGGDGKRAGAAPSASSGSGDAVKWTQCLRGQGLDVQDPPPGGMVTLPMDSPALKNAMEKCKQYQTAEQGRTGLDPDDPAQQERRRKFAKCMRDNGVDWPDPVPGQSATAPAMTPQLMDVFNKCSKAVPAPGGSR